MLELRAKAERDRDAAIDSLKKGAEKPAIPDARYDGYGTVYNPWPGGETPPPSTES